MNGGTCHDYEVQMASRYYVCAREFGWTPEQVDEVENKMLEYILTFTECDAKRNAEKMKRG